MEVSLHTGSTQISRVINPTVSTPDMFRLTKEQSSRMNIDSVIFPNISEQLHFSDNYVYLYVTHPVTEHADKLYLDLRLKCILKGKLQSCTQFRHDLRFCILTLSEILV
jgi:hypothetical protein